MHEKFDKFVDEMCIIDPEGLTGSTEMTANFRMWSRESGRDLFLSTSNYMDKRFGKTRIPGADKHTVVNGYKGVRIAENPYVLPTNPTIREQFLYEMCDRGVTFKSRQLDLINIFKDWFQKKNGEAPSDVQVRSSRHTWKTTSSRPMYTCRQMSGKRGKDTGCEAEGGRPSSPTRINDI
jgi:hypothetical protein